MAQPDGRIGRRTFLARSGSAAASLLSASAVAGLGPLARNAVAHAEVDSSNFDYTIRITPVSLELAPDRVVRTFGYNGTAPGAPLRLQEGKPVAIRIVNETDRDDIIHWHGLFTPSEADGAIEEGSPAIPPGQALIYRFTPRPAGTRWYHSHARADTDIARSTYSGQFGFMIIEPPRDPGAYDQEVLLVAHHWDGRWVSMQDMKKGPPPDNGLEVMYSAASFNGRMLGHGDPVHVRQGERVLFRILNASATMNTSLALPGHRFTVLALDGNPVPRQATVDVLELGVAERADVIVEMNNPGIWVLGDTDDEMRRIGLGIVVEYANRKGAPQWTAPQKGDWDYLLFGTGHPSTAVPDETINLTFQKILGGRGGYNRWTINGRSWPDADPLFTVEHGKRYRLIMNNDSGDTHPMHLHRHSFEVVDVNGRPTSGLLKDTINMPRHTTAEVDFTADNPGLTLFHCHHQDHMDEGLMGLVHYA